MDYNVRTILENVLEEMKKKGVTKRKVYNFLEVSPQTLDNYFNHKSDITLDVFLNICDLLQTRPESFLSDNINSGISNSGNIQNAIKNKGVTQTISNSSVEYELLKQENKHLKEKVELLERLVESYKN